MSKNNQRMKIACCNKIHFFNFLSFWHYATDNKVYQQPVNKKTKLPAACIQLELGRFLENSVLFKLSLMNYPPTAH